MDDAVRFLRHLASGDFVRRDAHPRTRTVGERRIEAGAVVALKFRSLAVPGSVAVATCPRRLSHVSSLTQVSGPGKGCRLW